MGILRIIVLFCLLFSAGGCKKKGGNDQFVHISFSVAVCSLDPSLGIDYPSGFVTKMLFEGLMYIGPDGNIHPAIAQSYEVSKDYMTYTFHLRPSYWSNGDKITAYDFEYSWKKVIDPSKGTMGAQNFYQVKNARAVIQGEKELNSVGIRALDDNTLQVELEHPTPYFLEMLTTISFLPVNAKVDQEKPNWALQDGKEFVCNGPYILEKHHLEDEIIVSKNPGYWNAEKVTMPGIQIAIIKDATTQLNLYEKNQLEWIGKPFSKIPLEAIRYLKNQDDIHFYKTLGLYWYFLNVECFPFNNVKMRKAFAYAINREAITNYILEGKEKPAMGVLPYNLATQDTPFFLDNNVEEAICLFNEALEEMEITKQELPVITLNYLSNPVYLQVAEALQEQWQKVFGVTIQLEHLEWKTLMEKLQKGNFQIGGTGWQSWLRDPIYIMQTFRDKLDGINISRWENKEYQALLAATEVEINPEKRKQLFNKAEALLMEEMPVIPIYFQTIAYAKSDRLQNVYISELYEVDFRWSYFKDE